MSDSSLKALEYAGQIAEQLENTQRIRTPALYFDQQAIEHNINAMLRRVQDPARWQPHIKTHKCAELVELCIERGVLQFKCATLHELESIASVTKTRDLTVEVLCAYPFYEAQWVHAKSLAQGFANISITWLVDSPAHFEQVTSRDPFPKLPLKIALDVDTGMHRTGTLPATWTSWLEENAGQLSEARLAINSLHGYEGHLGWSEQNKAYEGYDRLIKLFNHCKNLGFTPDIVTSGSHSYAHALTHPGLSQLGSKARVSPGTIVLNDLSSKGATEDLNLRYGALVASRIISSSEHRITLDAGSKALSPDVQDNIAVIVGHPQWRSKFQHEEHLVMESDEVNQSLKVGDIVWLIPSHVCTTVNLYQSALMINANRETKKVALASGHRWAEGDRVANPAQSTLQL